MALTLDTTLATAQDSTVRQPIVELLSTQTSAAIPFDGQYLTSETEDETKPSSVLASTGQIYGVSILSGDTIVFRYTDVNRLSWIALNVYTDSSIDNIGLAELANGNFGIIYIRSDGAIRYVIVSNTGAIVTSSTTIATVSGAKDPYVLKLANDSYLLVYARNDSDVYNMYTRTSSDFTTWSASAALAISGITSGFPQGNPALVQDTSDNILLFFDYADDLRDDGSTITNIYYAISDDNGATWDAAAALTSYTAWGTSAYNPDVTLNSTNDITLAFHQESNVLFANDDTALWQNECSLPDRSMGADMHFNPATNKLYISQIKFGGGTKSLCGVVVMDTTTWEVLRVYNTSSSPAYSEAFLDEHVWYHRHRGEGKYVVAAAITHTPSAILVINDDTELITNYVFKDNAGYGQTTNIEIEWQHELTATFGAIHSTFIDADNDRLYVLYTYAYVHHPTYILGYIDLTEAPNPSTGFYTWNQIVYDFTSWSEAQVAGMSGLLVVPSLSYVVLTSNTISTSGPGRMSVIDISSGGTVSNITQADDPSFPYYGLRYTEYYNGHVYGSISYTASFGQDLYKGMVDIDLASSTVWYRRPSYATQDDYDLHMKTTTGDGRLVVSDRDNGVAIYDIDSDTWIVFNNDTLPGFDPTSSGAPEVVSVAYDSVNDLVFAGSVNAEGSSNFAGVRAFNENGALQQGQYIVGEYSGSWSWGAQNDLSIGQADLDFSIVMDPNDVLWSVWTRYDNYTEYSLKWDTNVAELDLTEFIVDGTAVNINWSVEHASSLEFTLATGHLFDPNNIVSAFSTFLLKGRQIEIQFGELVDGVSYLHAQGTFLVSSTSMSYTRGEYPSISVTCESYESVFDGIHIVASDRYDDAYPETIIDDIVVDNTSFEIADIDIPELNNRHLLYHQWVDESLIDVLKELLDHFGYILYFSVDNIVTAKQITVTGDIDHVYVDSNSKLVSFSPDDTYSTLTNKVTVNGEGLGLIEVLYQEELVGSVSGTVGWWEDDTIVERINYSANNDKRSRNPRLEILTSIRDFKILWEQSGGNEYLSAEDTNETWVDISIECPGLMEVMYGSLLGLAALGYTAIHCDESDTCGAYLVAFSIMVSAVSYVFAQVARYSYEVYAQPVGEEKQSVYADADDLEFQQYLNGNIVNEEIADPYCYSVESCQIVADQELEIVKAQRKRITFKKLAHLQDEICDTIQILHPYSGQKLNTFITDLSRTFIKAKPGLSSSGSFTDTITGWRV